MFSAGVGQTGTLIAVDILLQQICENKKVDIFGTVFELRKQRVNMVQTEVSVLYEWLDIVSEENVRYMKQNNENNTFQLRTLQSYFCLRITFISWRNRRELAKNTLL